MLSRFLGRRGFSTVQKSVNTQRVIQSTFSLGRAIESGNISRALELYKELSQYGITTTEDVRKPLCDVIEKKATVKQLVGIFAEFPELHPESKLDDLICSELAISEVLETEEFLKLLRTYLVSGRCGYSIPKPLVNEKVLRELTLRLQVDRQGFASVALPASPLHVATVLEYAYQASPDGLTIIAPLVKPVLASMIMQPVDKWTPAEWGLLTAASRRVALDETTSKAAPLKFASALTSPTAPMTVGQALSSSGRALAGLRVLPWVKGGGREAWGVWKVALDHGSAVRSVTLDELKDLDWLQGEVEKIYKAENKASASGKVGSRIGEGKTAVENAAGVEADLAPRKEEHIQV